MGNVYVSMYVWVCICNYVCICVYMFVSVCTCVGISVRTCMCVCMNICTYACHMYVHAHKQACTYIHMLKYIHSRMCISTVYVSHISKLRYGRAYACI